MNWFFNKLSYFRRRGDTQSQTTSSNPQPITPPPPRTIEKPVVYSGPMRNNPMPRLDPKLYRLKLKKAVIKEDYRPTRMVVVQGKPPIEVTFCNKFVREVASWFGTGDMFEKPETNQAGEMYHYMDMHPKEWKRIDDWEDAKDYALLGHLLIAGDENKEINPLQAWSATGHVCVLAPEGEMVKSGKWNRLCPLVANVGEISSMGYGKGLNWAFGRPPKIFLYLGT